MESVSFSGNALINNSWKIVLTISDEGVELFKKEGLKPTTIRISYNDIKQIVLKNGTLEVYSSNEKIKIILKQAEAQSAANLIHEKTPDVQISENVKALTIDADINPGIRLNDNVKLFFANNGFTVSKQLVSGNPLLRSPSIYLDDQHKRMACVYNKNHAPNFYNYSDIIDFDVSENGDSLIKGHAGSAIAGGLLFGGLGAIAGASRSKKIVKNCTSLSVTIVVNDSNCPQIIIPLIMSTVKEDSFTYKTAQQVASQIVSNLKLIISQNKNASGPAPATNNDSLDQIEKLAELHTKGILTDEEFEAKKKQLLGI